jgi:hypothetical protein
MHIKENGSNLNVKDAQLYHTKIIMFQKPQRKELRKHLKKNLFIINLTVPKFIIFPGKKPSF